MCNKTTNYSGKKYNLLKHLHKMSVERYRFVMQTIPGKLNISPELWKKWLYLDKLDNYQIPYSQLIELSQLLGVKESELINYSVPQHNPILTNSDNIVKNQISLLDVPGVMNDKQ